MCFHWLLRTCGCLVWTIDSQHNNNFFEFIENQSNAGNFRVLLLNIFHSIKIDFLKLFFQPKKICIETFLNLLSRESILTLLHAKVNLFLTKKWGSLCVGGRVSIRVRYFVLFIEQNFALHWLVYKSRASLFEVEVKLSQCEFNLFIFKRE